MSLPWNVQQREWLHALGHPLLVLAGDAARAESPVVEATEAEPSARATPMPTAGLKPESTTASKPETKPETKPGSMPPFGEPDRADDLYRALLRATGQSPADAELALRQLGIDPATLYGNPASKRALWPRLRRLRARRPT